MRDSWGVPGGIEVAPPKTKGAMRYLIGAVCHVRAGEVEDD
jgi:hypothetical protein